MEKEIQQEPEDEGSVVAPVDEPAAQEPEVQAPVEAAGPEEGPVASAPAEDKEPVARPAPEGRPAPERRPAPQESDDGDEDRPRRRGRFRRRVCAMCENKIAFVDYKDFGFLRRFISDRARIESRRKSGTCAKHQRALARAIKRARYLALLPYAPEHIRVSGVQVGR